MIKLIRTFLYHILKRTVFYSLYILLTKSMLRNVGWFRSRKELCPVDREGNPLPFYVYPAIRFLENRVQPDMTVFEFGCGNSTLWWAKNVKRVISCEHDRAWYDKIRMIAPDKVEMHYLELEPDALYARHILQYPDSIDIAVIDGRDRVNCAKHVIFGLKEDGVIIWDNSDREKYQKGFRFLAENKFKRLDFIGMAPVIHLSSCTSIFYRENNCFDI
ncbi:FkbM family methyltransferase [Verrucomicrobiota bacterium]